MAIAGILVRLAKMPDQLLLLLEVYAAERVTLEGAARGVVAKCGGGWSVPRACHRACPLLRDLNES